MQSVSWGLVLLVGVASCGGGSGPSDDLAGDDVPVDGPREDGAISAGGLVLVPTSSMYGITALSSGAGVWTHTHMVVTDRAAACQALPASCDAPVKLGDRTELVIGLIGETPSTGTYAIARFDEETTPQTARIAELGLRQVGGAASPSVSAASGTVTITRFDAAVIEGTFAVTLDNAETLEGPFEVAFCEGYQELLRCTPGR